MKIKREIETINAKYDLIGLTEEQFKALLHSYEKYMYYYPQHPIPKGGDEIINKMSAMLNSSITVIQ